MHIDRLKTILREKALPPGTALETMRRSMESVALKAAEDITVTKLTAPLRPAELLRAPTARAERAILYLHGGGYVMGSLNTHRSLGGEIARAAAATVMMLDYRLAPEHAFPTGLEDAVAAYQFLLEQGYASEQTAIAGDSAGGGLTAATLLALRDRDLPLPGAAVCISPWADLSCSNESYTSRAAADPMVSVEGLDEMVQQYLQGRAISDPYVSPNLGDFHGLPPLLIHVGRDEVLLDDSLKLHEQALAAGVDSTLEVWENMIHVWHAFHPMLEQGRQGIARIGEFLNEQWAQE